MNGFITEQRVGGILSSLHRFSTRVYKGRIDATRLSRLGTHHPTVIGSLLAMWVDQHVEEYYQKLNLTNVRE